MRLNLKLGGTAKETPSAPSAIGFTSDVQKKQPTSVLITRLSEHADFRTDKEEPAIVPCQNRLPDPKVEDVKHRKGDLKMYDPSKEGREAWEKRQRDLGEADLGPPPAMTDSRLVYEEEAQSEQYGLIETKGAEIKTGPVLAAARHVTVGEASQYDRIPVDSFGMAMLMGMGFKPGESEEVVPHVATRRAFARAGLGADKDFELPHERKAREDRLKAMHEAEERAKRPKEVKDVTPTIQEPTNSNRRIEDLEDIISGASGRGNEGSGLGGLRDLV